METEEGQTITNAEIALSSVARAPPRRCASANTAVQTNNNNTKGSSTRSSTPVKRASPPVPTELKSLRIFFFFKAPRSERIHQVGSEAVENQTHSSTRPFSAHTHIHTDTLTPASSQNCCSPCSAWRQWGVGVGRPFGRRNAPGKYCSGRPGQWRLSEGLPYLAAVEVGAARSQPRPRPAPGRHQGRQTFPSSS